MLHGVPRVATIVTKALSVWLASAGKRFVLGTADEKALVEAFTSAIPHAARDVLPITASAEDVHALSDAMAELVGAEDLTTAPHPGGAASVSEVFAAVLKAQLAGLYDDLGQGVSYAETMGFVLGLDALVDVLLRYAGASVARLLNPETALAQVFWMEQRFSPTADVEPSGVEFRYVVARDLSTLADIVENRLDRLPLGADFLVENETSNFWAWLVRACGGNRDTYIESGAYASSEAYLETHPEATVITDVYSGWRTARTASAADAEVIGQVDAVTALLKAEGVAPEHLALLSGSQESCGDPGELPFTEWATLRPIWGLFLHVTAVGDVSLSESFGPCWSNGLSSLSDRAASQSVSMPLPQAPLRNAESALIPLATLVPGFQSGIDWRVAVRENVIDEYCWNTESIAGLASTLEVLGPGRLVSHLTTSVGDVEVRDFDPRVFYSIDRSWMIGSCPHLFVVSSEGIPTYTGAAFGLASRREQVEVLTVGDDAAWLVVSELEDEATFLRRVTVDGAVVTSHQWLAPGESIWIQVEPGQQVELVGYYVSHPAAAGRRDPFRRAALVEAHLAGLQRRTAGVRVP